MENNDIPFLTGEAVWYKFEASSLSKPRWIPGRIVDMEWMCILGRIDTNSKVRADLNLKLSKNGGKLYVLVESLDDFNFVVCNWSTHIKKWARLDYTPKPHTSKKLQLAYLRAMLIHQLFSLCGETKFPLKNLSDILTQIFINDKNEEINTQITNLQTVKVEEILYYNSCLITTKKDQRHTLNSLKICIPQDIPRIDQMEGKIDENRWKKLAISLITYNSEIVEFIEIIPQDLLLNIKQATEVLPSTHMSYLKSNKNVQCQKHKMKLSFLEISSLYLHKLFENLVFLSKPLECYPSTCVDNRTGTMDNSLESSSQCNKLKYQKLLSTAFNITAWLETDKYNSKLPNYITTIQKGFGETNVLKTKLPNHPVLCFSIGHKYGQFYRYPSLDLLSLLGLTEETIDIGLAHYQGDFKENIDGQNDLLKRVWYSPEEQFINIEILFKSIDNRLYKTPIHLIEEERLSELYSINQAYDQLHSFLTIYELERRLYAKAHLWKIHGILKEISSLFFFEWNELSNVDEQNFFKMMSTCQDLLSSIPSTQLELFESKNV